MKSLPSFGPTLPRTKPLSLFEGIESRSVNFTSSPVIDVALFNNNEKEEILFSNNFLMWLYLKKGFVLT